GQEYTHEIIHDFEERLGGIFGRQVQRLQVLDFGAFSEDMDQAITNRLRMDHIGGDGQVIFTSHAWRRIAFDGDFLGLVPSYTSIRDLLRKLCHRLITFSIFRRGQAPKKVTATDIFYLRTMVEETVANVSYLLAQYLFRYAEGSKQGARMCGRHFVARLAEHFRLITKESLQGLTVVVRDLTMIDIDELAKLRICERLGDTWAWVEPGPERQQFAAVEAAQAD
ncbi:hypothetical protein Tco_1537683, partial [Tanacetum coccineum]